MNWVDFFILGLIGLSMLVSLWRGFIKEALSLVTWIAAFLVALSFSDLLAVRLEPWIELPSMRAAAAIAVLFIVVLLIGGLINYLIGELVRKTGLGGTDRVLGTVFGVARGVIIVGVLVMLAGLTALPQDPWWQDSELLPHFQRLALWLAEYLPDDMAGSIQFESPAQPG